MADPKRRKAQEYAIHGSTIAAIAFVTLGAGLIVYRPDLAPYGIIMLLVALIGQLVSQAASYGIETYRFVGKKQRGSKQYEHLHRWNRVKVVSALHSLLIGMGLVMIMFGLASRAGIVQLPFSVDQVNRTVALYLAALGINAMVGHHESMHVELNPDRAAATRSVFWIGLQVSLLVGAFGAYLAFYGSDLPLGSIALTSEDASIMLLTAFCISGAMLMVGRGLPSVLSIMSDPRTVNRGGYASQAKSVVLPTIIAFTMLFVFILLIIVFGAGIFSVVETVSQSRSVIVVLALLGAAALAGIIVSVYLARQDDKIELFRVERSKEEQIEIGIAAGSILIALILLGVAVMINTRGEFLRMRGEAWMTAASFGLLFGLGPYGFYAGVKQRRINNMELRFPDFLRDLASSHKGGLTLVQSVQVGARGEYGALTPEIQRLADQLSWNVSFDEAFQRFGERVNTPLVQRSVNLVLEASRSGGSTTDVLLAAARDARELKTLERERKLNMSVYTTVIYVTFFVFLFVIGVLVGQFLPEIIKAGEASADSALSQSGAGLDLGGVGMADYRQFYFIAGAVQAIGNGMLAGIMGSGSSSLGLRHAFFMVLSTYITFVFIL